MGAAQTTGFYRFEAKIISRGGGRSLVASASYRTGGKSAASAAAYRAGVQLTDERTGISYDYTKKRGILGAEIMLPSGAPAWMQDRAKLWNGAEAAEKRKDAQTARDYLLSIPHQLSPEERRALVKWFVAEQFVTKGYAADIAWHSPDSREGLNHHAHVMVTMRRVEGDDFARTKDRAPAGVHPMKAWKDDLLRLREAWAHSANRFLAAAGLDVRITHESLKSRGIEDEPDPKLGPVAMQMELDGRESFAGNDRRAVATRNAERAALRQELAAAAAEEAQLLDLVGRRGQGGAMKPEPVTDAELQQQHEAELSALAEAQRQDAREAFKRQAEQQAEEAKKQREQTARDEALRQSEGDIPSAAVRYSLALADHFDVRDPYGSLAKAAMAEYGALVRSQEQLRQQIAKEPDADKRRVIELRKEIEATDYMALTSERLGGISATIAGRSDPPQAILHYARGEMYAEQAAQLRDERAAASLVVRETELAGRAPAAAQPGKAADPARPSPATKPDDKAPASIERSQGDAALSDDQRAKLDKLEATRAAYAKHNEPEPGRVAPPTGLQPARPGAPASMPDPAKRSDEKQADEKLRSTVTGMTEGDAELSDEKQAKLDRLQATRAAYAEHAAQKAKDRDRGGGGRSGR